MIPLHSLTPPLGFTYPPSFLLQVLGRDKKKKVLIFMEFCYWWERQILNRSLNYQVEIKEPGGGESVGVHLRWLLRGFLGAVYFLRMCFSRDLNEVREKPGGAGGRRIAKEMSKGQCRGPWIRAALCMLKGGQGGWVTLEVPRKADEDQIPGDP